MDHVIIDILSSIHNHVAINIPYESLWDNLFSKTCEVVRKLL
jgi:hypothetical protein